MRRLPAAGTAALAFVLAAVVAGCGASETEPAAGGADAVPASAAAYLSFESDLDSEQWQQVESLLERFPDGGRVLPMLRSSVEEEGVDWENDVEPALGPTVEVVWLDFANGGDNYVALTQPDDEGKLRELVQQGDDRAVVGEAEGWTVLAETQALIDRFRNELANGPVADDSDFQAAMEELPDQRLATVFVDGERARAAFEDTLGALPPGTSDLTDRLGQVVAGAAALAAEDDGFGLTAYLRSRGLPPDAISGVALLDEVPAGAYFVLGGRAPELDADELPPSPELEELKRELGFSLPRLVSALQGDAVLYARAGGLMPELTALLQPRDANAAKARLDELTTATRLPGERSETTIGDVQATVVRFGRFSIFYAAFDGRLVITTLPDGIRTLRQGGDKLVDEEGYRSAVEAAGVAAEDVVLYADVEQVLRLAEQFAETSGEGAIPPPVTRNLGPLGALVASSHGEGDVATFRLFLEIE